ncbi:MAG: hypothetical protein WCW56_01390 [Candidatus Paceibacterota bacterium]|jgi:hypothetical protein
MLEQKDNKLKDINLLANKGQRLSRAIYLVSSFVPDQDPLKWKIRERAIELMSDAKTLGQSIEKSDNNGQNNLESEIVLNKLNGHLDQLLSLMDLAVAGGAISEMNFGILKQETSVLSEKVSRGIEEIASLCFVDGPDEEIRTVNGFPISGFNRQVRTPAIASNLTHNQGPHIGQVHVTAPAVSNGQKSAKMISGESPSPINRARPNKSESRDNRKKTINDFVKGKSWTSIKDIATAVHGCSEKTVQRLLAEMVEEGALKKQGERRWSRYMLAQ